MSNPDNGNAPAPPAPILPENRNNNSSHHRQKIEIPVLELGVDKYSAFKLWKERWDDYELLSDFQEKDPNVQAALLRYSFTEETRKIYSSLALNNEEKNDHKEILKAMEKHAKGMVNETVERHI